jgi:hypothetical protein
MDLIKKFKMTTKITQLKIEKPKLQLDQTRGQKL